MIRAMPERKRFFLIEAFPKRFDTTSLSFGPVLMQDTEKAATREKFCNNGKPAGVLKYEVSASSLLKCILRGRLPIA